jgi:hypothetical protein
VREIGLLRLARLAVSVSPISTGMRSPLGHDGVFGFKIEEENHEDLISLP